MSGERAQRRSKAGKEWGGKRPLTWLSVRSPGMKFWKRYLHKIERVENKKIVRDEQEKEYQMIHFD